MALVFGVIFSSIKSGLMLYVFISGSTRTGVQPFSDIARIEAIYVFDGTIISSPLPNPKPRIIRLRASNPFAQPIQCLTPQNSAKFFSKVLSCSPRRYQPLSRICLILKSMSFLNLSLIFWLEFHYM